MSERRRWTPEKIRLSKTGQWAPGNPWEDGPGEDGPGERLLVRYGQVREILLVLTFGVGK